MKAIPIYADIYIRFREKNFGRRKVPGLEVETDEGGVKMFSSIDSALGYIEQLHNDNLKESA